MCPSISCLFAILAITAIAFETHTSQTAVFFLDVSLGCRSLSSPLLLFCSFFSASSYKQAAAPRCRSAFEQYQLACRMLGKLYREGAGGSCRPLDHLRRTGFDCKRF